MRVGLELASLRAAAQQRVVVDQHGVVSALQRRPHVALQVRDEVNRLLL